MRNLTLKAAGGLLLAGILLAGYGGVCSSSSSSSSSGSSVPDTWIGSVTDGAVEAIAIAPDGTTYIGGDFSIPPGTHT